MAWYWWTLIVIYFLGFMFVFVINLNSGPVTPALAFVRGLVWWLWLTTGHPRGEAAPFD